MTDITITYAEQIVQLQGELAKLQYNMDHFMSAHMLDWSLAVILGVGLALVITLFLGVYFTDGGCEKMSKAQFVIIALPFVVLPLIIATVMYIHFQTAEMASIARIEAEIATLEAML